MRHRPAVGALTAVVMMVLASGCVGAVPPATPAPTAAPARTAAADAYLAQPGEQPTSVKAAWCAISAGFVQMFVARDYNLFARC